MDPAWKLATEQGIRVGTASWAEKTMLEPGLFYPEGVRSAEDRLRFYAERFPLVEVDATYYALPAERNAELWAQRTPDGFVFNVKAFSLLTQHPTRVKGLPRAIRDELPDEVAERSRFYAKDLPPELVELVWDAFASALRPLARASKLGAVLFQFPHWFVPNRANHDYLLRCQQMLEERLPGVPCAIEFRAAGWMSDAGRRERSLRFLADHGLPYVCVDMPQGLPGSLPAVATATAPLAMVRFHGRDPEHWSKGTTPSERFRYDYADEELAEWLPRLDDLADEAREVHVLMNNCYRDQAVRAAQALVQLALGDA